MAQVTNVPIKDAFGNITGYSSSVIPQGWDAATYTNFKTANPTAEVTPEDTFKMLNAGSYSSPTPTPAAPTTINSGNTSPQSPIPYATPTPVPVYTVGGLNAEAPLPDLAPTKLENQATDLSKELQTLNDSLVGKSAYRTEQENAQGLPTLLKTQNDLSSRLKGLQNEALAIPLRLQQEASGRGITAAGLAPIQVAQQRENAIQALSVSSLLEASRGNVTLAYDLVDRAVSQKYDPIQERIDAATKNLDIILKSPEYTLQEKNRAQRQLELQNSKQAALDKAKEDAKEIYNLSLTAIKYGADSLTAQKMQKAKTPQEAIQIGSNFLADPKAKYELESARLDNILKKAQIEEVRASTAKKISDAKETTTKATEAAKAAIPAVQDKISLIGNLLKAPGLNSAVGPSLPLLGRSLTGGIPLADAFGAKQSFIAGVQQLVNKETLDAIIDLKSKAGGVGALSDSDVRLLNSAATKIGTWAQKDKDGNVTGYNINEGAFKAELQTIQDLAQRAYDKAVSSANIVTTDEKKLLTSYFSAPSVSTATAGFTPALYFNN